MAGLNNLAMCGVVSHTLQTCCPQCGAPINNSGGACYVCGWGLSSIVHIPYQPVIPAAKAVCCPKCDGETVVGWAGEKTVFSPFTPQRLCPCCGGKGYVVV